MGNEEIKSKIDTIQSDILKLRMDHDLQVAHKRNEIDKLRIDCKHEWKSYTDYGGFTETYCTNCGKTTP